MSGVWCVWCLVSLFHFAGVLPVLLALLVPPLILQVLLVPFC